MYIILCFIYDREVDGVVPEPSLTLHHNTHTVVSLLLHYSIVYFVTSKASETSKVSTSLPSTSP